MNSQGAMPALKELCRKYGFGDATFDNWCSKYGGMEVSYAHRLKRSPVRKPAVRNNNA